MSKKVIAGNVDLSDIWMDEIPDFLAVDELQGNLRIDQYKYPSLRSLKNSPRLVKGTVVINSTNIRDLQGSPQMILGNFELDANAKLDSLKGVPRYVTGIFSVQFSEQLRSLDHGWPEKVKIGKGFQLQYSGEMDAFRVDDVLKYYDVDPNNIFINDAYEDQDMYELDDDLDVLDRFDDR